MMKNGTSSTASLRRIGEARDRLLAEYIDYLRSIDEADASSWATIVKTAREAGLDKDTLCHELSCAWSTILRWEAGQTVPGLFARTGIKARFVALLEQQIGTQKAVAAAE